MHEFCKANDIIMEAYSPLTHGHNLNDTKLTEIAGKYHKSVAQILLRWCMQKGIPTIPKSVHEERIRQNTEIFNFEISAEDMTLLDSFRN
jgi:diketogulonate reductase-like aldo/keto reductase